MMKYIAKPDTWFDDGTEAKLIEYLYTSSKQWIDGEEYPGCDCGLFEGICEGKIDQEICGYDEFEIIEDERD